MNYNNKKRIQIINYIFYKLNVNELSKELIGKLFYLSNKLFLLKYGCTITGDRFVAFQRGTTCSETLALMDRNEQFLDEQDSDAIKNFDKFFDYTERSNTKKVHSIILKETSKDFSTISKREKDIIDIVLYKFGKMNETDISNYTHLFLEWKKYNNGHSIKWIKNEDIFKDKTFFNDNAFKDYIDEETVQTALNIYNGDF